jgi:hypothetical protein
MVRAIKTARSTERQITNVSQLTNLKEIQIMTFTINFTSTINLINSEETILGTPKSYTPLPVAALEPATLEAFQNIAPKLHGSDLDMTDWAASSMYIGVSGFYEKAFHAALVLKDDAICVQYGKVFVPVDFTLSSDLTFQVQTYKYDQYAEASLIVYDDVADVEYPITLRLNEETFEACLQTDSAGKRNLNIQKLAACAAKGNWDKFKGFLREGKAGGGSTLVDIKTLAPRVLYKVDQLREVNVSYNGVPALSYIVSLLVEGSNQEMWLPSNLKQSAELGKIVAGSTHIGYYLTEVNASGKQYVKGFISQTGVTALPVPVSQNMKAIEVAVEPVATTKEEATELPFSNRASAVEWAQSVLPHFTLEEINTELAAYKKTDFFNRINELATQADFFNVATQSVPF